MQQRMKDFPMTPEAVTTLLKRAAVGRISTIGADGYPYTVAVHFCWDGSAVYFHGFPRGEKLDNIARCPKVCFEVSEMTALLTEGIPIACKADTAYESVVIKGEAALLTDPEEKRAVFGAIVEKYLPHWADKPLPDANVKGTAVVKITPKTVTGKYHA